MRRSRRVFALLALLAGMLVCCGGVASCRTSKLTGELVVLVTTDLSVPKDIDTLHVNVLLAGGQTLLNHDYALGPTGLSLPATLGVVAGPHTTAPVTIQVSGLLHGSTRVARETVVTLPTDRMAMLPMPLEWLCIGVACNSGETCRAGTCVSATDPATPKDYLPASGDAGGTAEGGGACFDTSACFESATLWPASFGADCTVSRPRGGAGVNVALLVRGGAGICGSGSCLVPLDAESTEGWQTSPDGARIELPLAVCANRDVTAVEVTTSCPTKQANAAICPGMSPPDTDGGCAVDADGGCPEGYVCEAASGKTECVLVDSGTMASPRCHADSTLPCAGGATGVSCNGLPDPSLQCDKVHDSNCSVVFGWCCIPAADAATCSLDAGATGVLIDDMSGQATGLCVGAQIKLSLPPGGGTAGYWYTVDDGTGIGSMFPAPYSSFTYTPVAATCSNPFSNAACMKSVTPYQSPSPNGWALMGFNFGILAPTPDSGTLLAYDVSGYKGIRFWAKASDSRSQSVSIQFLDVENDMFVPGHSCANVAGSLGCGNFYQETQTFQSTWSQHEVDFDKLTQRRTSAQGFLTTSQFDQHAALGIQFVVDGSPLTFDVCVSQISFVPK